MQRRHFLSALGGMGAGLVTWHAQASAWLPLGLQPLDASQLRTDSARVFDLSVSSADPSATGVILWTHIRADAVKAGEALYLQVAMDAGFRTCCCKPRCPPPRFRPNATTP